MIVHAKIEVEHTGTYVKTIKVRIPYTESPSDSEKIENECESEGKAFDPRSMEWRCASKHESYEWSVVSTKPEPGEPGYRCPYTLDLFQGVAA